MKKKILIITTGGTLACVKSDNGLQPGMSSEEMLSYITDITEFYEVDFDELFQLDTMTLYTLFQLIFVINIWLNDKIE